jgi:hemerythrin
MPYLWEDNLATGDPALDLAHRELLDAVNRLQTLAAHGGDADDAIARLKSCLSQHQACEENLQRQHAYPGYSAHIAAHRGFAGIFSGITDKPRNAENLLEAYFFVGNWLIQHFKSEDRALVDYIREQTNK